MVGQECFTIMSRVVCIEETKIFEQYISHDTESVNWSDGIETLTEHSTIACPNATHTVWGTD